MDIEGTLCTKKCTWSSSVPISTNCISYLSPISILIFLMFELIESAISFFYISPEKPADTTKVSYYAVCEYVYPLLKSTLLQSVSKTLGFQTFLCDPEAEPRGILLTKYDE